MKLLDLARNMNKYRRYIIYIIIATIIFGFFLIPQFSGLRRHVNRDQRQYNNKSSYSASISDYTDPTTGMEFMLVKGGCFDMGDTIGDGSADERPVHPVCLEDFYIGRYEVTQNQWYEVMNGIPSRWSPAGGNGPVVNISWDLAQAFIQNLNKRSGGRYRLPTEAEWEYAARSGGKKEKWSGTSETPLLGAYAWCDANSGGEAHRVGQKKPNGLGLYDMSGNVWELVADWYDASYFSHSPKDNPQGPAIGSYRVLRGGSWFYSAMYARASNRSSSPTMRSHHIGLRLVMIP